ncbi:MAG: hypothetical protein AAF502_24790 [Bacteroidota bacterium]
MLSYPFEINSSVQFTIVGVMGNTNRPIIQGVNTDSDILGAANLIFTDSIHKIEGITDEMSIGYSFSQKVKLGNRMSKLLFCWRIPPSKEPLSKLAIDVQMPVVLVEIDYEIIHSLLNRFVTECLPQLSAIAKDPHTITEAVYQSRLKKFAWEISPLLYFCEWGFRLSDKRKIFDHILRSF